jgi:hypothetical protein
MIIHGTRGINRLQDFFGPGETLMNQVFALKIMKITFSGLLKSSIYGSPGILCGI